jgi:L-rhamnonate dehydratase
VRQRLPGATLASGEHWYTIQPFAHVASRGLVDILQPDALWVGGITASVKICHLAEAHGVTVIGHAGMNYPFGQHLALAMPAIAWGERSEGVAPPGVPLAETIALPGTVPIRNGFVRPTDAPGFGLEITKEWLEERAGRA